MLIVPMPEHLGPVALCGGFSLGAVEKPRLSDACGIHP